MTQRSSDMTHHFQRIGPMPSTDMAAHKDLAHNSSSRISSTSSCFMGTSIHVALNTLHIGKTLIHTKYNKLNFLLIHMHLEYFHRFMYREAS